MTGMQKIVTARKLANRLNVGDRVVRWYCMPSGPANGHAVVECVKSRRDYRDGTVSIKFESGDLSIYPADVEVTIEFDL